MREFFEAALDSVGEGICAVDKNGTVRLANRASVQMLGWTVDELRGKDLHALLHHTRTDGTPYPLAECPIARTFRYGVQHIAEDELFWRKDGTALPVELTASPIVENGVLQGVIVVFRDITLRKQAAEAERRAREAEAKAQRAALQQAQRMASLGTLAAGVAHEINNPLAFIVANLGYLAEELRAVGLDDLGQVVAETREGVERVRSIVHDLRRFAQPDEGRTESVDVRQALEWAISTTYGDIRRRARLVKDCKEVGAVVATEARLGQVFLNLLQNAAQAIVPGDVDGNEVRVSLRIAGGSVVFEVRDTGEGIRPEHLGRIFDPFFSTRRGRGLGLSVVHGLVAQMGGEIEVTTELGKGSTFRLRLPVAARAAAAEPESTAAPVRVLVVEGTAALSRVVRGRIEDAELVVAENTEQALLCLRGGESFDVILCDASQSELRAALERWRPEIAGRVVLVDGGAFTARAVA